MMLGATVRLTVDPARVARWVFLCCLALEVTFVLLDYHVNYGRLTDVGAIRRMTNIAREDGVASWFGITQTLLVALTVWGIWLLARARRVSPRRQIAWMLLAIMFTYMAVDDGAQIHERLGTLFSVWQEAGEEAAIWSAFPSYDWQILFAPVFGGFGLLLLIFLMQELETRQARAVVVLALFCFVTAVGLDFLEGLDAGHPLNLQTWIASRVDIAEFTATRFRQTPTNTLDHFSRSLEEFLEMVGMTLLWVTFLRHLPTVARHVEVDLRAASGSAASS